MAYAPPAGNKAHFNFVQTYSAPAGNASNFNFIDELTGSIQMGLTTAGTLAGMPANLTMGLTMSGKLTLSSVVDNSMFLIF